MSDPTPCEACGVSATDINDLTGEIDSLKDLLRQARNWVLACYPESQQQAEERESFIQQIDEAAPMPPEKPIEYCTLDPLCTLLKGHTGDCDDIPF